MAIDNVKPPVFDDAVPEGGAPIGTTITLTEADFWKHKALTLSLQLERERAAWHQHQVLAAKTAATNAYMELEEFRKHLADMYKMDAASMVISMDGHVFPQAASPLGTHRR